jgi:4a-hydroxytetrahydrobiopterin dehydratase
VPDTLNAAEISAALRTLPGWDQQQGALHRVLVFADFRRAFAFMTAVAAEAEASQHHPDWRNVWSRVEVWLSTHDAGGITQRDVALARKMSELAREHGAPPA